MCTSGHLFYVEFCVVLQAGYRDRAKERRQKYGIPETPEFSKSKTKYSYEVIESQPVNAPISGNNIGNKMLKAMGWVRFALIFIIPPFIVVIFIVR